MESPNLKIEALSKLKELDGALAFFVDGNYVVVIVNELSDINWSILVQIEDDLATTFPDIQISIRAAQGRDCSYLFPRAEFTYLNQERHGTN